MGACPRTALSQLRSLGEMLSRRGIWVWCAECRSWTCSSLLGEAPFAPVLIPKSSILTHGRGTSRSLQALAGRDAQRQGKITCSQTHRCPTEMLPSTLPWGDVSGDPSRKRRLKLMLEAAGLGLPPTVRHDGAAQGAASQHIPFEGNAVYKGVIIGCLWELSCAV